MSSTCKKKIFVFGSNRMGIHRRGAAKTALENYGAIFGNPEGLQGDSYALPTKYSPSVRLSLQEIRCHIGDFLRVARLTPDELDFQVTRVGCGLAGYKDEDIAPMFKGAPSNCSFDEKWKDYLGPEYRYWGTHD